MIFHSPLNFYRGVCGGALFISLSIIGFDKGQYQFELADSSGIHRERRSKFDLCQLLVLHSYVVRFYEAGQPTDRLVSLLTDTELDDLFKQIDEELAAAGGRSKVTIPDSPQPSEAATRRAKTGGCMCGVWATGGSHSSWCPLASIPRKNFDKLWDDDTF